MRWRRRQPPRNAPSRNGPDLPSLRCCAGRGSWHPRMTCPNAHSRSGKAHVVVGDRAPSYAALLKSIHLMQNGGILAAKHLRTLTNDWLFARISGIMVLSVRKGKRLLEGIISAGQCRAARAAVGWSQIELAEAAAVSRPTVQEFERGARMPHRNHLAALRVALEGKGVCFWAPEDGMSGLQFPAEPEPSPDATE